MHSKDKKSDWRNFKEKLEGLKAAVDGRYLLESLGFKIERESGKELRSSCPIHGGDNTTAFRFNRERNSWVCFTGNCHKTHGNDIIGLIMAIQKVDFMSAVEYLKQLVGDIDTSAAYVTSKRNKEMREFVDFYGEPSKPDAVNEDSLKSFKSFRSKYFNAQGFSNSLLDIFEIAGGWTDQDGVIRDIIPIRDDKGELAAYSLRDTRDLPSVDTKYLLTPGFDKDKVLYNLHEAQKYSEELPIIVVEGFKSVWKMRECGINNAVAIMGSSITDGQQALLCQYAMKGVVVMFDNDLAGANGAMKAINDLRSKLDVIPVFITEENEDGSGCDPADLNCDLLCEYLNTYY